MTPPAQQGAEVQDRLALSLVPVFLSALNEPEPTAPGAGAGRATVELAYTTALTSWVGMLYELVTQFNEPQRRALTSHPLTRGKISEQAQERADALVSTVAEWSTEHVATLSTTGRPTALPDRAWAEQASRTLATQASSWVSEDAARVVSEVMPTLTPELADSTGLADGLGEGWTKIWISRSDSRVRPLHRKLHGTAVPTEKSFWKWPLTGKQLRYPGDPAAPIGERINCRCFLWHVPATVELSEITEALAPEDTTDFDLVASGSTERVLHPSAGATQAELDFIYTLLRSTR